MNPTIVSPLVDSVCKALNFTSDQRMQLAMYPDKIVNMAFQMAKGRKFNDKFHGWNFINSVCRKEFAKQTTSGSAYTGLSNDSLNTIEEKEKPIEADLGITPSIDLTTEQNLKQWEIYEMSAQHWAQQSNFHKNILKNRKAKYLAVLETHTPENLDRWRKKAAEIREEGIPGLGKLFEIKPESTTLNESLVEQPKTQEIEKDLTTSNVVHISKNDSGMVITEGDTMTLIPKGHPDYVEVEAPKSISFEELLGRKPTREDYLEKFKDHPDFESIKQDIYSVYGHPKDDPIPSVQVVQESVSVQSIPSVQVKPVSVQKEERVRTIDQPTEPTYNPFAEDEYLDAPLLL